MRYSWKLYNQKSDPKYKHQEKHKFGIDNIFFCLALQVYLVLENRWQRYFKYRQVDKKTCAIFVGIKH